MPSGSGKAPSNLLSRLRGLLSPGLGGFQQLILGFAGFWIVAGEAHVTSIAVRETYRHQGIGELMLISLVGLALEMGAEMVTLEVRVSNINAQKLYQKCGFRQVGVRRGYYTDNGEDALIYAFSWEERIFV